MGKSKKHVHQEHSVATKGKDIKEGTRGSRAITITVATFFSIVILISIGLITFTIIFFFSNVNGPSMMTLLNADWIRNGGNPHGNTDAVIVNRHRNPRQGDVIVTRFFVHDGRHQNSEGRFDFYIKRLIVAPSNRMQTIYFHQRREINPHNGANENIYDIYVDGVRLDESGWPLHEQLGRNTAGFNPIFQATRPNLTPQQRDNALPVRGWGHLIRPVVYVPTGGQPSFTRYEVHVYPGWVFYIGDNRHMSNDSRSFGPQEARHIMGVAVDIVPNNGSLPQYLWSMVVYYLFFGWAWGSR